MQYIDLRLASDIRLGNTSVTQVNIGNHIIWPLNDPYRRQYFTIEALDSEVYVKYNNLGGSTQGQYSLDNGSTWVNFPVYNSNTWSDITQDRITLTTGQKMLLRDTQPTSSNVNNGPRLKISGRADIYGNIMSLSEGDSFENVTSLKRTWQFANLFHDGADIVHAHNLSLPATTLTAFCYCLMFGVCTSLVTAPELPATTLASDCYDSMFAQCTSLVTAPELPATTLAANCYVNMFYGCTALTTAPELPVTTLASYCYDSMFAQCTSLVTAPELPATTLAEGCYRTMFSNCTSLVTAPDLPALTLTNYCYYAMFHRCRSLNSIKMMATDKSATNCTYDMLNEVAASGTFYKNANATWNNSGVVPSTWSVVLV